ncbi:hypothetical protein DENSPDRAFT_883825 [Dentipellis sp. KUC8613]|nr:hypothetical protein DENSPDRAFT_883825 [Dentipellis sp. KUC8613]
MSTFPGLNEDCAALILDCLDTPSLLSISATSRAALLPARVRLVRDVRLLSDERALSFLHFVLAHALEPAVRSLYFSIWAFDMAAWAPLLAHVLPRADTLRRLEVVLGVREPRFFALLRGLSPALTHLHIYDLTARSSEALRGIRGLRLLSLSVEHESHEAMQTTMGVIKAVIADNADTLEDVAVAGPYMRGTAPLEVRFVPAERKCPRVTRLAIQRLGFDLAAVAHTFPNVERLERDCEAALPDDAESGTVWPKLGTLVAPARVVLPMVAQGNYKMLRCLVIPPSSSAPLRVEDTLNAIRNLRIEELSLSIPSVNLGDPSPDSDGSVLFLAQILGSAPHLRKLDLNIHDNSRETRKVDLATLIPNPHRLTKAHTRVLSQLTYVSLAWPSINTTLTDKSLQSFARPWFTLCPRLAGMHLYPSMLEFRWTRRWLYVADCSDSDSDSGVDLGDGDSYPRPRSIVTAHYRCNPKSKQASFDNERTAFAPNDHERGSTAWSAAVCKSYSSPGVELREGVKLTEFPI